MAIHVAFIMSYKTTITHQAEIRLDDFTKRCKDPKTYNVFKNYELLLVFKVSSFKQIHIFLYLFRI